MLFVGEIGILLMGVRVDHAAVDGLMQNEVLRLLVVY